MLPDENIQSYLKGVSVQQPEITIDYIKALQNVHLATFPFSSLGVLLQEDLSLESQVLFARVVTNRRGGYCFEHNKVFFEILKALGFQCDIVMGRVLHNRQIDVPRTHRITRVTIDDKKYLVDVGFGPFCPREPLLLQKAEAQDQGDAVYRIVQPGPGRYLLQIQEGAGWFTLYSFDDGLYTEADCLCGHHFSSTHPDATFVNNLVVAKKSYGDIRFLRNGEFHRIGQGTTRIEEVSSEDELGVILRQEFGLRFTAGQLLTLYRGYCEKIGE